MRLSASTRAKRCNACRSCGHNKTQPNGRAEWCDHLPNDVQLAAYRENSASTCPENKWPDQDWRDSIESFKQEINDNKSQDKLNEILRNISNTDVNTQIKNTMREYIIAYYNKIAK